MKKLSLIFVLSLLILSSCAAKSDVDVDLSKMSGTVCYAQVNDMVNVNPAAYFGKTVRMSGTFAVSSNTDTPYFACLIADATACCQQGIEFQWAGEHSYPDDYPEKGAQITVTGIFGSYKEGDYTFYTLKNAELSF